MRWILIVSATIIFLALAFTFFYFNQKILLGEPPLEEPSPIANFDIDDTIAPVGASLKGSVITTYDISTSTYIFRYFSTNKNLETEYKININDESVKLGLLKIWEDFSKTYPVLDGGTYYRNSQGIVLSPSQLSQLANVQFSHSISNSVVSLRYVELLNGLVTEKQFDIELVGKTLVINAYAINPSSHPDGNYAGLSLEKIGNINSAHYVQMPFMKTATVTAVNNEFFISTYLDWTKSNSNEKPLRLWPSLVNREYINSFASQYIGGKQTNAYPAFSEVAYVTVSKNVHDTMMGINREKSPYRDSLNNKLALHISRLNEQSYRDNTNPHGRYFPNTLTIMKELDNYGVKDLFFILHSSMYIGNNGLAYPKVCPPSTWYGSLEDLNKVKDFAISNGYYFAPVHDNRIDMFQSPPYWDNFCDAVTREPLKPINPDTFPIAIDVDGKCRLSGWYEPRYSPDYFYTMAQDKMINYAVPEMQCLKNVIDSNAHYLDVSAKSSLDYLVDYSNLNSESRTIAQGIRKNIELNEFIHSSVNGPISAEGGEHVLDTIDTLVSGSVDAFIREINQREDAPVIPDFELIVVKPLSANQGMGPVSRWVRLPPGNFQWSQPIDLENFMLTKLDKYRSTIIAFGHTGLYDDEFSWNEGSKQTLKDFYSYFVKEYYILSKLQELYLGSEVQSIQYYKNNNFIDLSTILNSFGSQIEQNEYFENLTMLKTTYNNGLKVYVNRHNSQIWQVSENGITYYLPSNGWLAYHPSSKLLVYSALVDPLNGVHSASGKRVDCVKNSEYVMVDGRDLSGPVTKFPDDCKDFSNNIISSSGMSVFKPSGWYLKQYSDKITIDPKHMTFYTSDKPLIHSISKQTVQDSQVNIIQILGDYFFQSSFVFIDDGNTKSIYPGTLYKNNKLMEFGVIPNLPGVGIYKISVSGANFLESNPVTLIVQKSGVSPILSEVKPFSIVNNKDRIVSLIGKDFTEPLRVSVDGKIIEDTSRVTRVSSTQVDLLIHQDTSKGIYSLGVITLTGNSNSLSLSVQQEPKILAQKPEQFIELPSSTSQVTIGVTTDVLSTCRYSVTPGLSYIQMQNKLSTTPSLVHETLFSEISAGSEYKFYIRCQNIDSTPVANFEDYIIQFSVANRGSNTGQTSSAGTGGPPQGKTFLVNLNTMNRSTLNLTKYDILKINFNKTNYSLVLDSVVSNIVNLKLSPGSKNIPLTPNIWLDVDLDGIRGDDVRFRVNEIYSSSKVSITLESLVPLNRTRIGGNISDEDDLIEEVIDTSVGIRIVFWIISIALILGIAFAVVVIIRLMRKRIKLNSLVKKTDF